MDKTLKSLLTDYVKACGGSPIETELTKSSLGQIENYLSQNPSNQEINEYLTMIENYIENHAQEKLKIHPPVFSGAEGNLIFKINLIRQKLNLK